MEVVSRDTGCYTTDIGKMAGTLRNFYIHHSHNALVLDQDSCIPPLRKYSTAHAIRCSPCQVIKPVTVYSYGFLLIARRLARPHIQ